MDSWAPLWPGPLAFSLFSVHKTGCLSSGPLPCFSSLVQVQICTWVPGQLAHILLQSCPGSQEGAGGGSHGHSRWRPLPLSVKPGPLEVTGHAWDARLLGKSTRGDPSPAWTPHPWGCLSETARLVFSCFLRSGGGTACALAPPSPQYLSPDGGRAFLVEGSSMGPPWAATVAGAAATKGT